MLAGSVFHEFDSTKVPGLSIERLWHHSVRTARYAAAIATMEDLTPEMRDAAFTAGLLHDVGKLVLAANLPELYTQVLDEIVCGVVHIADAIAEGLTIENPAAPECHVSTEYLDAVGLRHRWGDWREACRITFAEEDVT